MNDWCLVECVKIELQDYAKRMQRNFGYCPTEKSPIFWAKFRDFSAKILNRFGEPHKTSSASPKFTNLRSIFRSFFIRSERKFCIANRKFLILKFLLASLMIYDDV